VTRVLSRSAGGGSLTDNVCQSTVVGAGSGPVAGAILAVGVADKRSVPLTTAETKLLTLAEVARRLNCSQLTVRRRIQEGELPAVRLGSSPRHPLRVDERELNSWLYGSAAGVDSSARRRRPPLRAAHPFPGLVEAPPHDGDEATQWTWACRRASA
jgi:excisionase family DNA binding protein